MFDLNRCSMCGGRAVTSATTDFEHTQACWLYQIWRSWQWWFAGGGSAVALLEKDPFLREAMGLDKPQSRH